MQGTLKTIISTSATQKQILVHIGFIYGYNFKIFVLAATYLLPDNGFTKLLSQDCSTTMTPSLKQEILQKCLHSL